MPSQRRCIVTGDIITDANNSRAHIIPSALGGRLKPTGVLSEAGNAILNDKVDLPLVRAFQPIMSILGGARDRGKNPTTRLTDSQGKNYEVVFGKPITLTNPEYLETQTANGVKIEINARTEKEARTLLGKVKGKYPDFDIETAIKNFDFRSEYLNSQLRGHLQIGPVITFPATFAAASVYAGSVGISPHPSFMGYVNKFDPAAEKPLLPPDTFYWYPETPWYAEHSKDISHVISLVADTSKRAAIFIVEYFGVICAATTMPYNGTHDSVYSHAVEVTSGQVFDLNVDVDVIRSLKWATTHDFADKNIIKEISGRLSLVLASSSRRGVSNEIDNIIQRAWGEPDGRVISEEDINRLTAEMTPFLLSRIQKSS